MPTTQLYLGEYGVPGGRCRADNTKAKVVGDWCSNNSAGRENAADLVTVTEQQQWSRVLDNMMGLMDQVGLTGTYWNVGPGADMHSVHANSIDDALENGTPPVLVLDNHKGNGGLPGQ